MNVPGRTGIRFHPFNRYEESKGCTGLGKDTDYVNGRKELKESGKAIKHFEKLMNTEKFELVIRNANNNKTYFPAL